MSPAPPSLVGNLLSIITRDLPDIIRRAGASAVFAAQLVPAPVPPPADAANAPPPLFTAIQEQLGLKLEAQKVDAPVLVIDRVEHPSPN